MSQLDRVRVAHAPVLVRIDGTVCFDAEDEINRGGGSVSEAVGRVSPRREIGVGDPVQGLAERLGVDVSILKKWLPIAVRG